MAVPELSAEQGVVKVELHDEVVQCPAPVIMLSGATFILKDEVDMDNGKMSPDQGAFTHDTTSCHELEVTGSVATVVSPLADASVPASFSDQTATVNASTGSYLGQRLTEAKDTPLGELPVIQVKVEPDIEAEQSVAAAAIASTLAENEGSAPMLPFNDDSEDVKPSLLALPSLTPTPSVPGPSHDSSRAKKELYEPALLEPHGLPPVQAQVNNRYAYLFFRFCAERHKMWERRQAGVARNELSKDETMTKTRVGNIYRQLDPSGAWLREHVICVGEQSQEEICFRIFLYSAFYLGSTWQALVDGLGHIPSWKNFNLGAYETILYQRSIVDKQVIYYSGFQLVPPVIYFGRRLPHYAASLRMVKAMMEMGLPSRLEGIKYAVDASEIIRTVPTFGGFLSMCLLCNLNEVPQWKIYWRNFATCGPGSRGYLKRLFGERVINSAPMEQAGLRWLYENQWRYWARLQVDPPHAWPLGLRPGLRTLDCENSLCWAHRYVNDFTRQGYKSLNDLPFPTFDPSADEATFPAWCDEQQNADTSSKAIFAGDYEEEAAKLEELVDIGEKVYEVEKIVSRKGNRTDKNGLFRVRWKGYPPEDDTWEKETDLRDGSGEVVDEWKEWEERVVGAIKRIKDEEPYTGPMEGVKSSMVVVAKPQRTVPTQDGRRTPTNANKKRRVDTSQRNVSVKVERETESGTPALVNDDSDDDDILLITENDFNLQTPASSSASSSSGRPSRNRKQPQRLIDTLPISQLPAEAMSMTLEGRKRKKGKIRMNSEAVAKLEVDMTI